MRGAGRPLYVLLDQKDYSELVKPANMALRERIAGWVDDGAIVVPIADVHLIEAAKAKQPLRSSLLGVMAELSKGWVLRPSPTILGLESASLGSVEAVQREMLGLDFSELFGTPMEPFLDLLASDIDSREIHDMAEAIWSETARALSASRMSLVEALARSLGREVAPADVPSLRSVFRLVACQHALQSVILRQVPGGLTGHDVGDTVTLGRALPYFDVVGVDRAMLARIREAKGALRGILRARVERRLSDVVQAIDDALRERSGGATSG